MRIRFERSGGFAGLPTTLEVDSSSISLNEQSRVKAMIDTAKFFELPLDTPLPKNAADYFKYKITIENNENGKSRTITTNDMTMPSELRPLVDYLESKL